MSTKNRADRIQLLQKVVAKHFHPVVPPADRTVLEHLIYACCLEDAPYDSADEGFHRLQEMFTDWNEVRVTTVTELRETTQNLPDPTAASLRIKKILQSIYETRYSFDLQDMVKMNQGKAIQELEKLSGISKFVLDYATQNALGGHAIPISQTIMQVLQATEIVSEGEAAKGQAPGLERTVAKSKGVEFASSLHQLAVQYSFDPYGKQTQAIMKEAGATEPKKPAPKKAEAKKTEPKKAEAIKPESKKSDTKKGTAGKADEVKAEPAKTEPKASPAKNTKKAESKNDAKVDTKPETKKSTTKAAPAKPDTTKATGAKTTPAVESKATKKPTAKPATSTAKPPAKTKPAEIAAANKPTPKKSAPAKKSGTKPPAKPAAKPAPTKKSTKRKPR